jgi:hypothetical protein
MPITITKPSVNGSNNVWGDQINTALDVIVDAVNGAAGGPDISTVTSTAAELNLLDGATAETVVNSKAVIYGDAGEIVGTSVTGSSLAIDNTDGDWTFEVSSNKLIVKYGGTAKMELDTSGNLKVVGNVTAYGTIS